MCPLGIGAQVVSRFTAVSAILHYSCISLYATDASGHCGGLHVQVLPPLVRPRT